jgi:hypothetical protein
MYNGLSGYHPKHSPIHPILDQILAKWPEEQKNTVYLLINKYGLPNDASLTKITWYNNGPWKRTIVHLRTVPHNTPTPHLDYLEQTIDYKVPVQFFDDLAQFDGSLYPDRTLRSRSGEFYGFKLDERHRYWQANRRRCTSCCS